MSKPDGKLFITFERPATPNEAVRDAATGGSVEQTLASVYYSAQVLFFGAEFTRAYACRFGSISAAQHGSSSLNTG